MKKLTLLLLLFSITFFAQTNNERYYADTQQQLNTNIQNIYSRLGDIKTEVERLKGIIYDENEDIMSRRWIFTRDFIFNSYQMKIRAIESSIDVIPKVNGQTEQLIWSNKVIDMVLNFENELKKDKSKSGALSNLVNDIQNNVINITKNNYKLIPFDDLMFFLTKKTGYTESQIKANGENAGYKYTREYMESIVQRYLQ